MSTPERSGSGGQLRAEAQAWQPTQQAPRREGAVRPIRTSSKHGPRAGDVVDALDAIPFTPSQGVCTPSPTNMATMWVSHPFFSHPAWGMQPAGYAGSPGPSSGGSDSSMLQSTSQPGTPGGGMFGGGSMLWSGFCQPLPYSPTALQIAAASGALGSDPSTPVRGRPGSAGRGQGAAAPGAPFLAVMPGSPMMPLSPGQMMFAQYFGGTSSKVSHSPPESHNSSGSGDEGDGSDNMSSAGSGLEVSEAAHQIASAMCAAQQLPGEPPQQLLELASLLHAYGLVSAVPAFPPAMPAAPAAPLSPDSRRQQARQRQKAAPKLNADGSVRLNARQRRTLRRAQERAMKALLEAQTKVHGISSEQAAAHLANMGVASMLLGSPPPAQVAMAPPVMSPVHLPPSYMAPPPAVMSPQLVPSPHDFGMLQAAAAAGMMGQAGVMGAGYDAGYGLGGELHMAMPMHAMGPAHSTPPPRFGGRPGPGGYAARQGSGGYRGTPGGNRMSRFAPTSDAVAAF